MYREPAECEEKEVAKKWEWPTIERVNEMMIGTAGVSFIMGGIFLVFGIILHGLLGGRGVHVDTDPLVVRACLTAMITCWSISGIPLLYAAGMGCWYFLKVAMGKERV